MRAWAKSEVFRGFSLNQKTHFVTPSSNSQLFFHSLLTSTATDWDLGTGNLQGSMAGT
jgi:hypothetical protein